MGLGLRERREAWRGSEDVLNISSSESQRVEKCSQGRLPTADSGWLVLEEMTPLCFSSHIMQMMC